MASTFKLKNFEIEVEDGVEVVIEGKKMTVRAKPQSSPSNGWVWWYPNGVNYPGSVTIPAQNPGDVKITYYNA